MSRKHRDKDTADLPEDLRPPRAWPVVAAVVLACIALAVGFRNGSATGKVSGRVDRSYEVRCAGQRVRLTTEPKTEIDVKLRALALKTFPRDCPKG